jgi:hypothetical protein
MVIGRRRKPPPVQRQIEGHAAGGVSGPGSPEVRRRLAESRQQPRGAGARCRIAGSIRPHRAPRPPDRAARGVQQRPRTRAEASMIDREKVLAVLDRRFPEAPRAERAAAANAIVGLEPEYEPVPGEAVDGFRCETAGTRYTRQDLASGAVRLFRRRSE